jgi:predicted SnoaL-like aldol condensation-catalyzing enzyme
VNAPLLAKGTLVVLGLWGASLSAQTLSEQEKKDVVRALLRSLETRDSAPVGFINRHKFIQHDPRVEDGLGGYKRFVAGLPADTKVNTVRIFADGDYVVAHSEFTLPSGPQIGFDIFRFENGRIVEHWNNIEAKCPRPNGSGRTQIDGPAEVVDLDKTEANKALAREYFEVVVIGGNRDRASQYRGEYHQHSCYGEDNKSGFQTQRGPFAKPGFVYRVQKVHRVLGEGSSVLVVNEGLFDNTPTSFYDFYRIVGGKMVEHWDVLETLVSTEQWKNPNGKF